MFMPLVPHAVPSTRLPQSVMSSKVLYPHVIPDGTGAATNKRISTHLGRFYLRWTDHSEREGSRTTAGVDATLWFNCTTSSKGREYCTYRNLEGRIPDDPNNPQIENTYDAGLGTACPGTSIGDRLEFLGFL